MNINSNYSNAGGSPSESLVNYWEQSLVGGQNRSFEGSDSTLPNIRFENPVLLRRLYTPNPRLVSGEPLLRANQSDPEPSAAKQIPAQEFDVPDLVCKKTSYEVVQEANGMELGEERTGFLEAAFKDILRDFVEADDCSVGSVIDEAVQIANCMEAVRKQECLEIVLEKALDSDAYTYEYLQDIAKYMLGERKEDFLNEVFEEALEQKYYRDTFHIADLMEEDNKQACLQIAANDAYEAGEYKDCAYIADGISDEDMREVFLQRALEGAVEEGDFSVVHFIGNLLED